jgi:hypothetical protein
MDLWLQEKYILLLSNRFERFQKVSSHLYNMRCYFCGDSQKNKSKARAYLYKKKEDFKYHCHNCGKHSNFEYMLREIDPHLYYEMRKESLGHDTPAVQALVEEKLKKVDVPTALEGVEIISELPREHIARVYLESRKIPAYRLEHLYYVRDFRAFVDRFIKGKLTSAKHAIPRIIIPFFARNGELFGFQGRAVDPDEEIRYITIIFNDSYAKAYNLNNVDFNKRYYVLEGPFDSMFFENALAAGGSDMLSVLYNAGANRENAVIVFDNEPRNDEIVKHVGKAIRAGYKVCIWPSFWQYKDINDGILDGYTAAEINAIIDSHTYVDMEAMLEYSMWRKV